MSTAELALFVACLALALDLIFVGLVLLVVAKLRPLIEQARPLLGIFAASAPFQEMTLRVGDSDEETDFRDVDGERIL
jgi:hypothetical protein